MLRTVLRRLAFGRAELGVPVLWGNLRIHRFRSRVFANTRFVRVWTPPGFDEHASRRYPVLYLNDGQNLFDPATAFAGVHWQVGETATRLIAENRIPPLVIVGIDNTGKNRVREYIPYKSRDPKLLHPLGAHYPEFLQGEVMPLIERQYPILNGADNTGFGGSSLGGLITLYTAMLAPDVFGKVLIESPSLFVAHRRILEQSRVREHWPSRIYLGIGTREVGSPEKDPKIVADVRELAAILGKAGLNEKRLCVRIDEGAPHSESAWAARFPEALEFLYGDSSANIPQTAAGAGSPQPDQSV
jgi:enterochelin esterase-like enzyme